MKVAAHVSEYKKKLVAQIAKLINEYPIIGAVDMHGLPAPQLQVIRGKLRDKLLLVMARRNLLMLAIEQAKKNKTQLEELEKYFGKMPALLFTKESPFKLSKILKENKSKAPAKAGQVAPYDLVIPAGPTPFAPGPIIGELGSIGIKTGVEGGKVAVIKDSVVAKAGEVIKPKVADVLAKFGIQPMEIGIDLVAVWENGMIYPKDILSIDEAAYLADIAQCQRWAFNLSVEVGYFARDTADFIILKAFNDAKALASEAKIDVSSKAAEMIARAEAERGETKTETKVEESKEIKEESIAEKEKPETKVEETKKEERIVKETSTQQIKEEHAAVSEVVKQIKEKYAEPFVKEEPSAEEIVEEIAKEEPKKKEIYKEDDEASRLFEELKKRGTLRGVEEEKEKEPQKIKAIKHLEPDEIIEEYAKKKALEKERERVPSAHELLQKKLQKEREG